MQKVTIHRALIFRGILCYYTPANKDILKFARKPQKETILDNRDLLNEYHLILHLSRIVRVSSTLDYVCVKLCLL